MILVYFLKNERKNHKGFLLSRTWTRRSYRKLGRVATREDPKYEQPVGYVNYFTFLHVANIWCHKRPRVPNTKGSLQVQARYLCPGRDHKRKPPLVILMPSSECSGSPLSLDVFRLIDLLRADRVKLHSASSTSRRGAFKQCSLQRPTPDSHNSLIFCGHLQLRIEC